MDAIHASTWSSIKKDAPDHSNIQGVGLKTQRPFLFPNLIKCNNLSKNQKKKGTSWMPFAIFFTLIFVLLEAIEPPTLSHPLNQTLYRDF